MLGMLARAVALLKHATKPLALAGAGLSAESGIPTFRGAGGLWRNFKAEELATPRAFDRDPQLVWEWYAWRRDVVAGCAPNPAHHALVELEKKSPAFWLITQNVDGLSQRAGQQRMLELHGSLWRFKCRRCTYRRDDLQVPTPLDNTCPGCGDPVLRPDVVWFGEALDPAIVAKCDELASQCDLLFVLGTSANVYPAASYVPLAARHGATIIEINPDPTPMSNLAAVTIREPVGQVLPEIVRRALG
jgi:NAD-dependent deacetylase